MFIDELNNLIDDINAANEAASIERARRTRGEDDE